MYLKSVLVKFEDGWPWPIFEVTGVNLNMKIAIFACKHDNSTNINRIGHWVQTYTMDVFQECLG